MKKTKNEKVVIAMSGGVDSSVAAAFLKKAGSCITGVFLKLVDLPNFKESEKRAKKIAKILGIKFLVLDLRKEFKKRIIDCFLKEYKRGTTPNPCVVCNKEIKFGLLLEKALALGADFVATGHYARLQKKKDGIHLLRGKDEIKDQSYFLWQLKQKQLKHVLFPVGDYTKSQVRNLAKRLKLPTFEIPESQDICFVQTTIVNEAAAVSSPTEPRLRGEGKEESKNIRSSLPFACARVNEVLFASASARVNDFLTRHLRQNPGKIICSSPGDEQKVVGEHQGLHFYTIGQRKGIGLAGGPYYVLNKDTNKNLLIVTKKKKDLLKKELIAKNVNWISGEEPKLPLKIKAKIRYRHQPATAIIFRHLGSKVYSLKFKVAQRAITPGQSVVFYLPAEASAKEGGGQELVGGGIIC